MRIKRTLKQVGGIVFSLILFALPMFAQSNKGTILGTVTDPQGALINGAKVTATNIATGLEASAETGSDGVYTVPNLQPGRYKVTVVAAGFKTLVFEAVTVETNARLAVDAAFTEVTGAGENTVTITAESGPLTQTESSSRGDIITGRQVTDLPIGQRNFTVLAALSPGVNRPTSNSFGIFGGGNCIRSNCNGGSSSVSYSGYQRLRHRWWN